MNTGPTNTGPMNTGQGGREFFTTRTVAQARSGFRPRRSEKAASGLEFMHTVLLLIAEKPE